MTAELETLLRDVRASDRSAFYADLWKGEAVFEHLPKLSRTDLMRVPLSARRYKNDKALVKIVRDEKEAFLSEWSFKDIGLEAYGEIAKRPFVYMSDPHEALEKSMWCYETGQLPFIAEKDPTIAAYAANRYRIDSLITDAAALQKLGTYLSERADPLEKLSIIGSSFDIDALLEFSKYAKRTRLVLALPEAGAFAEAMLEQKPKFHALPDCVIESKDTLVVTKLRLLVTPIIRYDTGIPASLYAGA